AHVTAGQDAGDRGAAANVALDREATARRIEADPTAVLPRRLGRGRRRVIDRDHVAADVALAALAVDVDAADPAPAKGPNDALAGAVDPLDLAAGDLERRAERAGVVAVADHADPIAGDDAVLDQQPTDGAGGEHAGA